MAFTVEHSELTAYNDPDQSTHVVVPAAVVRIGKRVFSKLVWLISVVIPELVTHIYEYAFYECVNLALLNIPKNVLYIGNCAFYGCCALESITIPEGVTYIGICAFYGCTNLVSLIIPGSVTHIGANAFAKCTKLISASISQGVTHISDGMFSECTNLVWIDIPPSILHVSEHAFYGCSNLKWVIVANETEVARVRGLLPESLRDKVISKAKAEFSINTLMFYLTLLKCIPKKHIVKQLRDLSIGKSFSLPAKETYARLLLFYKIGFFCGNFDDETKVNNYRVTVKNAVQAVIATEKGVLSGGPGVRC